MIVRNILKHWRSIVIILVPLLLLPLALDEHKESKCGYVVLIMALYWITEAVPLPVTSLLPVVLFPLLGILSTEKICTSYLKETTMMFLGGLIVAIAVEHCNLHKRIALKVLLLIGTSPKRLILGFMLTTMFLSMWISNTASTAMMAPIASAVLDELKTYDRNRKDLGASSLVELTKSNHDTGTFDEETRRVSHIRRNSSKRPTKEQICYFLGIAYAANIGGTGTLTGTGTNLTFKGLFEESFPKATDINFATWMQFNVPLMLINCFLAWIWLQVLFLGLFRKKDEDEKNKSKEERSKAIRSLINQSYQDLGPMTYHEANVLTLFLAVVVLWFFRKPEFITGWADLFDKDHAVVDDATPAILAVFLLFVLPANLDFLKSGQKIRKASPALINWKIVHEKVPWGLVLLLGGGFAMAAGSKEAGLSKYIGQQLSGLEALPKELILAIICLATTFLTEVSSNAAIANILIPVLAEMTTAIGIHPLYLMLPATISCSYAFMLPVATPPNAIVVAASNLRTIDMMKAGFGMNLICCISLIATFSTFGSSIYGLDEFPKYAHEYVLSHNLTSHRSHM